jgi:hypothetical protein
MIQVRLDAWHTVEELQDEFNFRYQDHRGLYGNMAPHVIINNKIAESRLLEFYNSVIIGMIYGKFGS